MANIRQTSKVKSGSGTVTQPPTFTVAPTTASLPYTGGTIQFTATASTTVSYSLTVTRTGITINSSTGLVTVASTAAGTSGPITVQATANSLSTDAVCAVTVEAAASGAFTHGSLYTVTKLGGGLGTRSDYNFSGYTWNGHRHLHFRWTDYAGGEPTTNTKAAWLQATSGFYPNDLTTYLTRDVRIVAGGPSQSGKYSRRRLLDGNRIGGMSIDVSGAPNPIVQQYICFKFRMLGEGQSSGQTVGKFYRQYTANGGGLILGPYVVTDESTTFPQCYWNAPVSQAWHGNWNKWEIDQANGSTQFRTNGAVQSAYQSSVGSVNTFPFPPSNTNVNGHTIDFPNMVDDTIVLSPYEYGFADIYVDFTRARVEVTASGKTEVQPVNAWADSAITVIANKGELPSGAATLRVIGANNAVLHTQQITVT